MTFFSAVRRLLVLPGRLMIGTINGLKARNGVGPLNGFQRGAVHGFVWICALIAFSMAVTPATTATAVPTAKVTTARPSRAPTPVPTMPAVLEGAVVARVIDGDTFELTDGRRVRVLGIDSCESDTPGGDLATALARQLLVGSVGLTAQPGVDVDHYGRLLRYVQTSSGDFGVLMVPYDHTGIYQGHNDASQAYLAILHAHDLDQAANPPSGRECGAYPPAAPPANADVPYVPLPDSNDNHHHKPRFCRHHWFC